MESLADFLGVKDPLDPERPQAPAPKKMTAKAFCTELLSTPQYRESLLRRIIMDELPPAVENMMWHYAHGKPVDHLEVKDTTNRLESMTAEQLEERALFLAELARTLRERSEIESSSSIIH